MLRYYDETGLLKPAEIDRFTGYRLYSAGQIPALGKIVFLRDLGFGVADIATALEHGDDSRAIGELLETARVQIERTIESEQEKLAKIKLAKRDLLAEKIAMHYNVGVKSVPACRVFSLRRTVPDYYAEGLLWKEMSAYAAQKGIAISDSTFTIYHDPDYRERDVDIEICSPVSHAGPNGDGFIFRTTEPVPLMAYTMVRGPFENIAGAYLGLADWLQQHSEYGMGETSRQIVLRGPWNEENPAEYLTEIQVPLKKK